MDEGGSSGPILPERQQVRMHWAVRIPMRDAIQLTATLYIPREHPKPTPVLFTLTPYVAQISHDAAVYFAERGYPFLTIDVRGRGNSTGEFKADSNEGKDVHDITEWLVHQPYCNGKVAMWGGSYSGYVQWAGAAEFPPHLVTIVPAASPFRGVDSPAPNNIFMPYRIQWLHLLAGRASQEKAFADQSFWTQQFRYFFESGRAFRDIDILLGNSSAIFQEWLSHPRRDAYWESFNPTPQQYANIAMPILTITGAYDGNQRGALQHYREHLFCANASARARHYLIIGPWDHAGTRTPKAEFGGMRLGPASLVDLGQLHLEWYAWTMQSGAKPAFLRKNVAYYVTGSEQWRHADTLADIGRESTRLYLDSRGSASDVFASGSLQPDRPTHDEPDRYVYDPRDVSLAELESKVDPASLVDQRMLYARTGQQLVYHSTRLDADVEVAGFFRLSVWLSIDQPDTDFLVCVHEVSSDGSSIQLSTDCMRARYRESLREERLITTTDPLRYDFERFTFVARRIRRGSRLRLVIGPLNSIFWEKNYNGGGTVCEETIASARPVTVKLFHDAEHPSVLHVPLGEMPGQ